MFNLPAKYAQDMLAHARAEAPNECCGLIAGKKGEINRLYRTANVEKSPIRYSLHPQELLNIINEIEAQGWDLLGIYHSHTHSPAYPSATDIKLAFWPDSLYFIISLMEPEATAIRTFRIADGAVIEEEVKIGR